VCAINIYIRYGKTNIATQITESIPRIQYIYFPRQCNSDLYGPSDAQTRFIL